MNEFKRGWPVLLAAALGNGGGLAAVPVYSLSSFIRPLGEDFGWSRGAIGLGATIITVGIFLTGPIVGGLCDRHGARRLVLPSMALLAAGLAAMSLIGGSITTLYLGLAGLALVGAATTSVVYTRVVNTWFERSRGLALGLTMTGSGFTAMLMPLILGPVIAAHGWQTGFLVCAAAALLPLPFAFFLLRERGREDASQAQVLATGVSVAEAMRDRRFWMMAASALIYSATAGGVIVHSVPMLSDMGFGPAEAGKVAALMGLGILFGRLIAGVLLDRFHGPLIGAGLMITAACGLLVLHQHSMALAPFGILLVGVAIGSEGDLLAYFTSRYFGMRNYAGLFGWLFGVIALGTALGPILTAAMLGPAGYAPILLVFIGQCLAAAVLMGLLGRYPVWDEKAPAA